MLSPPLSIGQCATLACVLEATAPKVGNVHRGADFEDLSFADFLVSAVAIGPAMEQAISTGVGQAVLSAVQSTRQLVATNVNLGIVLLLGPLAAVPRDEPLTTGIQRILFSLAAEDCRLVYEAIRAARPSGLGNVEAMDVRETTPDNLLEAMGLARNRDLIARQYVENFALVLDEVTPAIVRGRQHGWSLTDTIIHAHVELIARHGDSLIVRKCGSEIGRQVSAMAADVLAAGGPGEDNYLRALSDFDYWLRSDGHRRNPGTTADLIAAGLFALLRDGLIEPPYRSLPRLTLGLGLWTLDSMFSIRLEKEHHVFSAAHFITFAGNVCERLHGHNYRVEVEIFGPLDENKYVVDFIAVRDELKKLTDELDHRVLLPQQHPLILVTADAQEVMAVFTPDGRRWIFPRGDCAILPVANTTAELLAQYLAERLRDALKSRLGFQSERIRLAVDENHGQWGVCDLRQ